MFRFHYDKRSKEIENVAAHKNALYFEIHEFFNSMIKSIVDFAIATKNKPDRWWNVVDIACCITLIENDDFNAMSLFETFFFTRIQILSIHVYVVFVLFKSSQLKSHQF